MFNAEEVLKKYAPKIEEDEQISMPEIIDKVGKSKEPILENIIQTAVDTAGINLKAVDKSLISPKDWFNYLTSPAIPTFMQSPERKASVDKILGKPSETFQRAGERLKQAIPEARKKGETDEQYAQRMTDAGMFWAIRTGNIQQPTPPSWVPKSGIVDVGKTGTPNVPSTGIVHSLAKSKGLISIKGKPKPQYRRLANAITGVKSTKDMSPEQMMAFQTSLSKLPEPKIVKGVPIAPSIPTGTALTPEGFFNRIFKEPSKASLFTSQSRYADLLGIKSLVEPFEKAKIGLTEEYSKHLKPLNLAVKKAKKTVGTEKMAQLLNTNEVAPQELTGKAADTFNYFDSLRKLALSDMNSAYKSLGQPEIKGIKGYYRHMADSMADDVLSGKYPLPEGSKYWSEKTVSKKVFNPMEIHRKIKDDLLDRFSKDLGYVTKSMLWTSLKVKHFSIPKHVLNKELGLLSKDKANYSNLTPEEAIRYDAQSTMPASTKNWLIRYVNEVLMGKQPSFDESWDNLITKTPVGTILNSALKPFGKHIGRKPLTGLISKTSMLPIYGVMGGIRPKQLLRNKFQPIQNMALYGVRNTARGYMPVSSFPHLEKLMGKSDFLKSYSGFEDTDVTTLGNLKKMSLATYQWSAVSNVRHTMKSAYHWTANKIQNQKFKGHGWADPQRNYNEAKDFFYPSEEAKLLKEMEYGAHTAQYGYLGMHMPEMFRYKSLSGITRLQSWWMNHFFTFHREAATRAFMGHVGYDENIKVTVGDRFNYLKYLILGGLLLNTLGYGRSYLFGAAPTSLPPTAQLVLGMYTYSTSQGDEAWQKSKRRQAGKQIKNALATFIPLYLTIKDLKAFNDSFADPNKSWTDLFFYNKGKKNKPVVKSNFNADAVLKKYGVK